MGAVASAVGDFFSGAAEAVTDVVEGAGNVISEVVEGAGNIVSDAGAWIDENITQPMLEDPITSLANIAAIAAAPATAGQSLNLLPVIAGASVAAKGGELGDIALAAGTSWISSQMAPNVGKGLVSAGAGKVIAAAGTGLAVGATTGAITAGVRGKDILEGATKGGIIGGVAGGVSGAVSEGYNLVKNEFGIGNTYTPNLQADADFLAAQAESARAAGAGEAQIEQILRQEGVQSFTAADVASMTASGIGEKAVAQNIAASYSPFETYNVPKPTESMLEREGKKIVSKAITGEILEDIYAPPTPPQMPLVQRRTAPYGTYSGEDETTGTFDFDSNVALTQVAPSKYELRKFENDAGNTTMISFKDDEPQTPIPVGYKEVERIGAAEGGLMTTNMVKYSKKPLLAPRKKVTKPKKTASKGLASKK
jgi:hypothetical protein